METFDAKVAQAEQERMNGLRKQAEQYGLSLDPTWTEPQIRHVLNKHKIPQLAHIHRIVDMPVSPNQTIMEFHEQVVPAPTMKFDHDVPYTSAKQQVQSHAYFADMLPGYSFAISEKWSKTIAQRWGQYASMYRKTFGLTQDQFDIRTAPDPKNPQHSRIWRIV